MCAVHFIKQILFTLPSLQFAAVCFILSNSEIPETISKHTSLYAPILNIVYLEFDSRYALYQWSLL